MTLPVSVIVVSRGRPQALARCLTGLSQLLYPVFEVIVVADPAGLAAVARWGGRIKRVSFDAANISAARNAGLAVAAGQVVAFIDDDAVPEPTWASHLVAPFALPEVMAAGGHVLGRNGISRQWPVRDIRADGQSEVMAVDPVQVTLLTGQPGRGIKTEGTNMAFRAAALRAAGGFDPAYRFYLDEADLNLRLAATGAVTAIVPQAVVHHGFAASDRRRQDRVPETLHEVGASLAVLARRHGAEPGGVLAREVVARRAGLVAHMVAGRIEPGDVRRPAGQSAGGLGRGGATAPSPPCRLSSKWERGSSGALPPTVPTGGRRCWRGAAGRRGACARRRRRWPGRAGASACSCSRRAGAGTGCGSTRRDTGSRRAVCGAGPRVRARVPAR